VDLQNRYIITSNRESGFGRYDVILEPKNPKEDDAILLEFKVHDPEDEASLDETVQEAHRQIERKQYAAFSRPEAFRRNISAAMALLLQEKGY